VAQVSEDIAALDRELAEIELLVGQARAEAARHEQKRVQATEKLASPDPRASVAETTEAYTQLVTLTKRAVLMESQVDVLEGKRKALARHRAAIVAITERMDGGAEGLGGEGGDAIAGGGAAGDAPPANLSRVVLSAQEDLRREIARSMHDGPAQSLTNIVLQAQIVDRLLAKDPTAAQVELKQLMSMVQQTLDATKTFIFDVRPMVLDDLGLVPTLRRATRDRGRRVQIPVEFDSLGAERRLPMDVESTIFRVLDEALAGYLALGPDRVSLKLDWGENLEARLVATKVPVQIEDDEVLPDVPTGDVPDAIRQMIQDRHDKRQARIDAAAEAALISLPALTRRDVSDRAAAIGATVEVLANGAELQLVVPLPAAGEDGGAG
jgi:two-component system, NarL family, sensor histidine kinase DegS